MKYKICPSCHTHNASTALECQSCFADLLSVRVTDDDTEKARATAATVARTVRICESCGFANPANTRKCQECGEDISDVMPTEERPVAEETQTLHYTFASLDGLYAYELQPGKTVIGQEETMADYLQGHIYVSRRQAELTLEDGKLTLLNLSRTNGTFVNNTKCGGEPVELHDGDEIGLGGLCRNGQRQDQAAYFMVRIGTCS